MESGWHTYALPTLLMQVLCLSTTTGRDNWPRAGQGLSQGHGQGPLLRQCCPGPALAKVRWPLAWARELELEAPGPSRGYLTLRLLVTHCGQWQAAQAQKVAQISPKRW